MMPRPGLPLGLVVALVVAGAVGPAAGQAAPLSREQALGEAGSPDPTARRQAMASLGAVGAIADTPVLLRALRDTDPAVRAAAEESVWLVWSRSGDAEVDRLFAVGVEQMSRRDGPEAIETFTRVIERKPDFAEGWNKRATVYFLMGEYEKSLRDCDEVMKRNPEHFGALAGYGQIYLELGQPEKALEHFERALAINPNLTQVELVIEHLRNAVTQRRRNTI